ncbi:MAG: BrnA antitoxin family protein [Myxococcaceae bacterium]
MPIIEEFPFELARKITDKEVTSARKAIEKKLGIKRTPRGRHPKGEEKFRPISIRLHPKILEWAKEEAGKLGIGYQTVINNMLLKEAIHH